MAKEELLRKYGTRVGFYELTVEANSKKDAMFKFGDKEILLCNIYELPNKHGIPMKPTKRKKG